MNDSTLEALLAELRKEKQATSTPKEELSEHDELPDYADEVETDEELTDDWHLPEAIPLQENAPKPEESWDEPQYDEIEDDAHEPAPKQDTGICSEKPAPPTDRTLRGRLRTMMEEDITPPSQTFDSAEMTNRRMQHRYTVLGAILVAFAIVGMVSTVLFAVKHLRPDNPNAVYQEAVAKAVMPLVVMDSPMFQSVAELSEEQMLTAGIWSILTHGGLLKYPEELGLCTVPATDVDAEIRKLYLLGDRELPQHRTIGATNDLRCYYDEDDKSYRIPTDILHFSYVPKVRKLEQNTQSSTDTWYAEVAYLPDLPAWQSDSTTEPTPSKVVKITLVHKSPLATEQTAPIWQVSKMEQIS